MFVAGEIKPKLLRKFSEVFFDSPFISKVLTNLTYFYHFVDEKSLEIQQIWTFDVFSVV